MMNIIMFLSCLFVEHI